MGMKFLVDDCSICEIVSRVVTWRRWFHDKVVPRKETLIEQNVLIIPLRGMLFKMAAPKERLFHRKGFFRLEDFTMGRGVPKKGLFPRIVTNDRSI